MSTRSQSYQQRGMIWGVFSFWVLYPNADILGQHLLEAERDSRIKKYYYYCSKLRIRRCLLVKINVVLADFIFWLKRCWLL